MAILKRSIIRGRLLGLSALVLFCVGLLSIFLSPFWSISLFGLALVALIGSLRLNIGPAESKHWLGRVAVIVFGVAVIVFNLLGRVTSERNFEFGFSILVFLVVGGFGALMFSIGYRPPDDAW